MALILSASLSATKGVLGANPASTDYVNQHIAEAVNSINASMQKELNKVLVELHKQRIKTHQVGEFYQGGVIFYVDESGLHGLIAATKDANNGEGMQWQNGESGEKVINARANGIGGGQSNTRLIIAEQTIDYQAGRFAALAAANYSVLADGKTPCATTVTHAMACYGDWYLPSIYELDLMRLHLTGVQNLTSAPYWSSTEVSVTEAFVEQSDTGEQVITDKSLTTPRVRAIRAF